MTIQYDNVTNQISVVGSDANLPVVFQSKGTGAINLAPGSSGLNLSNGGTVTAITRTAAGALYTGVPSVVISAPTTAGGVQAVATCVVGMNSATVTSGGTGYTLNDVLTVVGGTGTAAQFQVTGVSGGVINAVTPINSVGAYSVVPTSPFSVTGGTGSSATLSCNNYAVQTTFTITNAGSGYVEQPTVTFSGGGGSGAVAFATIGSNTSIRTQGSYASFFASNSGSESLRLYGNDAVNGQFQQTSGPGMFIMPAQSGFGALRFGSVLGFHELWLVSGSAISLTTGSNGVVGQGTRQLTIPNTVNAVNFASITGGITGAAPVYSVVGSDTNIGMNLTTKGTGAFNFSSNGNSVFTGNSGTHFRVRTDIASASTFWEVFGSTSSPILRSTGAAAQIQTSGGALALQTDNAGTTQLNVTHTASAVNFVQVTGAATGSAPVVSAQGSDANIPLRVASKGTQAVTVSTNYSGTGTGNGQFNISHTANSVNVLTVTGAATGAAPAIFATGSDTNIPLVLQPKGTGALQAQATDSTATGGNARGPFATDLQRSRSNAAQVASGGNSFIGSGNENSVLGSLAACVAGNANAVNGYSSFIGAGNSNTASNVYSSVTTGVANTASNFYTTVVNGSNNTAGGYFNFIGNGFGNFGTANAAVTTQSATMNGTTAVTLSGSNASIRVGQLITGTSINTSPNTYVAAISGTSLTLSQAASGSSTSTLSFFTPHGVVVGGGNNQATGSYSFIGGGGDAGTAANRNVASGDWSTVAGGFRNTASGSGSFIGGGGTIGSFTSGNSASGGASFIGSGLGNTASNTSSVVAGGFSNTANSTAGGILNGYWGTTRSIAGMSVFPSHNAPIASSSGVTQASLLMLGVQTTDATATVLRSDTNAAGTTNQVILPNNSAYFFRGEVVSGVTGGGNTKGWTIEGVIKRGANAASTALVGTPTVTSSYADAGASSWVIAVTADTTNGGLAVTFTGQAGTTIRTVCQLFTTEMTF